MHGTAHIDVAAAPLDVWRLVADVTQIGRFSPETFEAEWLDGATGPAPGARFRGHVKRNEKGPVYWTECTVVDSEPGTTFAFAVSSRPFGLPLGPRDTVQLTWRYDFEAVDGGTRVTESFTLARTPAMRLYWRLLGWTRGPRMRRDMARTLRALKAAVER